jgi:Rieske Fe-S protein
MLHQRSIQIAVEQRRQRRALIIFVLALLLLLGFCGLYGLRLLMLQGPPIPVGAVAEYTDQRTRRFDVPRLKTSTLIQRRDQTLSEDVIYVRRENGGDWTALLGVDTLSGCFLYWDEQAGLFHDISCLGARYTRDGRYLDGLQSGEQPQNMARLPVEVRDGQVFVRDEIARGVEH